MIRAVTALRDLRERENYRYLNASSEEKGKIKEEWGIIENPTEEKLKFRRYWCKRTNMVQSLIYGTVASAIPSLVSGFATLFYMKPEPKSLEGFLPAAVAATTAGGIVYASMKIGNLLHRRKHPTARECNNEYVRDGLELITELEKV